MDLVKSKERATGPARSDDGKRAGPPEPAAGHLGAKSLLLPEKLPLERWIALGVFTISLLYLCLFRRYTSIDPDEGIILQGAQRIVHRQVLYRDFFSFFTPGSYYLLALLFKVFGSSMLVARTALAAYGAFFSVFTYLLARRVCSRGVALAAAYLVTWTCLPWRFMILHNWDSTLCACATVYCAVWLLQAPRWGWALATGSFASLTVLFEQSKGVGLVLGLGLGLILLVLFARSTLRLSRGQWVTLGIGLAWPFALTLAYFAAHHALPAMLADWFWPLHNYSKVNSVPYGYQDWSDEARMRLYGSGSWLVRGIALFTVSPCFLLPVLPIIAIMLLIYWLLEVKRERLAVDRAAYYILVCSSIVGLLFSVLISRADIIHFVHLTPLLYLVLAWVMDSTDVRGQLIRSIRPLVSLGILITFTTLGMAFLVRIRSAKTVIETRRGVVMAKSRDDILAYVQTQVPAGSRILVYPYLPLYYYLTATFSPTSFDYLQPGMHTHQQEQEVIHQVSADRTSVIVFQPSFNDSIAASWPKTSLASLASDPVADYILANYRPCRVLVSAFEWDWRFVFMVRKDLACPDTPHSDQRPPSDWQPQAVK
ncbi:MAG: glycosyltransferase family 39 protein [Terriglobia bacterium]|jgi:4-amino-4-deoxy-L-arabinose transferase-like glycosyltransferase